MKRGKKWGVTQAKLPGWLVANTAIRGERWGEKCEVSSCRDGIRRRTGEIGYFERERGEIMRWFTLYTLAVMCGVYGEEARREGKQV
jgi:hypothetical protein